MNIVAKNGAFNTEELYKNTNKNLVKVEESSRVNPKDSSKYPIGYVIPLGTLGNAPNQTTQFKSNFHLVAYTIADDLLDKTIDFEDFNINDSKIEQGQIYKLIKKLNDLAKSTLGFGWNITVFNVKMSTAIDSMSKGSNEIDMMNKSINDLQTIISNRIGLLGKSNTENAWQHEIIELFYTPLKAISCKFVKLLEKNTQKDLMPLGICNNIIIETLVYDSYANGLRLLTNTESFASSKLRMYNGNDTIYLLVLKARIVGETDEFRPIRQYGGKSRISKCESISGCAERIIYNLVNKNYKHWSFISIPENLDINLYNIE